MSNLYSGLINGSFKGKFNNAIDALIESLEKPCKIYYPPIKYEVCECSNMLPAKRGPAPFPGGNLGNHSGICPTCKGESKIPIENSESLNLIVIFDFKQFYKINPTLDYSQGIVQTLCNIENIQKIKGSNFIYFNTDISHLQQQKYQRVGEPQPIGLGSDRYIITDWEKR